MKSKKADISKKSVGILIDELITTSIKCFLAQEAVMNETDVNKIAKASKDTQNLNKRRNLLINAIDESLDLDIISPSSKTY